VSDEVQIRAFRDDDDIPAITALLHAAYAPLAEMGLRYLASHQDDDMTIRRLKAGWAYVGELSGQIVATVTLRASEVDSPCEWYREPHVFTFGQFAVHPTLQRRGIGHRLMQMIEREAAIRGASELALDTSEGATHLCDWYSSLGYRFIQHISWHDTNYRSVVLSKLLTR
jgi:predicted N-acetyltransferase YhbS